MSWYNEKGIKNEVVVSTRCRFARNLSSYKFPSKMTNEERDRLIAEISDAFINSNQTFRDEFSVIKSKDVSKEALLTLFEKHLISRDMVKNPLSSAAIINKNETVSIMLMEEDHVRLQVILPGYQTAEALKIASDYEKLLDGRLDFAKDERLGYLTACPTNLGSGLRISAMLHLPALTSTKRMSQLLNSVGKLGITIRGMYGEGTEARGCLYQLSNQVTLGLTNEEILSKVNSVIDQIVTIETKLREDILKTNEAELKNRAMRSYGILKNSYTLTSEEAIGFLSDVRLGKALGLIDTDYEKISEFLVKSSPAYLISESNLTDPTERDKKRATLAKEIL